MMGASGMASAVDVALMADPTKHVFMFKRACIITDDQNMLRPLHLLLSRLLVSSQQ